MTEWQTILIGVGVGLSIVNFIWTFLLQGEVHDIAMRQVTDRTDDLFKWHVSTTTTQPEE